MNTLNVIGSDVDNFECPWCGCNDRERHLILYFDSLELAKEFQQATVLHFAPERALTRYISSQSPSQYLRIDLSKRLDVDLLGNMERLPFPDQSIDIIIANHVLEHVGNLQKSLSELQRVLSANGIAILQTPFSSSLEGTFQDAGVSSPEQRRELYGQEDHVRLFGRDIASVICAAGFKSQVVEHDVVLRDTDSNRLGVNKREPLLMFRKATRQSITATCNPDL